MLIGASVLLGLGGANLSSLKKPDEAIVLAQQALKQTPCISACDFAPKDFLSMVLELLVERGETESAASWKEQLSAMVTGPSAGLAELGYQAVNFARIGDSAPAVRLIEEGEKPA